MTEDKGSYILVVDDEESIRELISYALTEKGYQTRTAMNGKIALSLVEAMVPRLVILDINMPGLSGLDVLEEIRIKSDVPVIMLSVRNDVESISNALESGADDYISKPFSNSELVGRVQAIIGEP